jgi:hypothetical protein
VQRNVNRWPRFLRAVLSISQFCPEQRHGSHPRPPCW